jgi:hypothetical protein
MPGHNHPHRPARRRAHWHWGYHRSLQIFPIKEGKQAVIITAQASYCPQGLMNPRKKECYDHTAVTGRFNI